jgi:hypothetical protein
MRGYFLFTAWCLLLFVSTKLPARAELLCYDPFLIGNNPLAGEYTLGPLAGQNPTIGPTPFFTGPWQGVAGANEATVQSAGLNIRDVPALGGSVLAGSPARAGRNLLNPWDASAEGTYYMSFVMNFGGVGLEATSNDVNAVGHRALEMWSAGGTAGSDADLAARIGYMSYNGVFGGLPPASAPLIFGLEIGTEQVIPGGPASFLEDVGVTHLFVLKFILSDQATADIVQLFLDPAGSDEPTFPSAEFSGVDFTLGSVSGPVQFGGAGSGVALDEIRVGTEFSDVAPPPLQSGACSGMELGQSCYLTIVQSMNGIGLDLEGDLNHDGRVDLYDLRIWRDNRTDAGHPEFVSVPEPSGVLLILVSSTYLLSRQRQLRPAGVHGHAN